MKVKLSATIANFKEVSKKEFLDYLLVNNKGVEFNIPRREQSLTGISNNVFDWNTIIDIAALAQIIQTIWVFYSAFVEAKKPKDSKAGIIINITFNGNADHIWIGNDIKTKEDLEMRVNNFIEANTIEVPTKSNLTFEGILKKAATTKMDKPKKKA